MQPGHKPGRREVRDPAKLRRRPLARSGLVAPRASSPVLRLQLQLQLHLRDNQPASQPFGSSIACLSFFRLFRRCCFVLLRSTDSHLGLVCSAANDRARLAFRTVPRRTSPSAATTSTSRSLNRCCALSVDLAGFLWLVCNSFLRSLVLGRGLVFTVLPPLLETATSRSLSRRLNFLPLPSAAAAARDRSPSTSFLSTVFFFRYYISRWLSFLLLRISDFARNGFFFVCCGLSLVPPSRTPAAFLGAATALHPGSFYRL